MKTTQYILYLCNTRYEKKDVSKIVHAQFLESFWLEKENRLPFTSVDFQNQIIETIMKSFRMEIYSIEMTNGSVFAFKIEMEYIFREVNVSLIYTTNSKGKRNVVFFFASFPSVIHTFFLRHFFLSSLSRV